MEQISKNEDMNRVAELISKMPHDLQIRATATVFSAADIYLAAEKNGYQRGYTEGMLKAQSEKKVS